MAEFVQRVQQQATPNFTGASRGIQFDRVQEDTSLATLFEGMGNAGIQAVTGADTVIQENIREDVAAGIESIDAEFGVDSATDFETGIFDPNQPGPSELADSHRHLKTLQAQRQSGQLKEAHYWARAQSLIRQLRGRYPGYRAEIDQMVQSVTGVRPANALRRELMQEWGAGADDHARRLANLTESMANDGSLNMAAPDFWQRQQSGQPYGYEELLYRRSQFQQREAEKNVAETELWFQNQQGQLDRDKALRHFRVQANQSIRTMLRNTQSVLGEQFGDLRQQIRDAQESQAAGQPWSAQELEQLRPRFARMREAARASLESMISTPWGDSDDPMNSYLATLEMEQLEQAMNEAMRPIDEMEQALFHKDYGSLSGAAAFMEAIELDAGRSLLEQFPVFEDFMGVRQIMGADGMALFMGSFPEMQTVTAEVISKAIKARNQIRDQMDEDSRPSMSGVLDSLRNAEDVDDALATEVTEGLLRQWTNVMERLGTDEQLPLEAIQREVQFMFGPENYGVLSKISAADRRRFFTMAASPRISDKMLQLREMGDENSWNTYQQWTVGTFQRLFNDQASTLQEMAINPEVYDVAWNPQQNRFDVVVNPELSPRELRAIEAAGELDINIRQVTEELNRGIQSIIPIIEANDMNASEQMLVLLHEMGFDPESGDIPEDSFLADLGKALERTIMTDVTNISRILEGEAPRGTIPQRLMQEGQNIWEHLRPFLPQFRAPEERGAGSQTGAAAEVRNGLFLSGSGLNIEHNTSSVAQYGRTATRNAQPFEYIVMHHAVGDTDNLVQYGHTVDRQRGGSFGYHFYIAEDGRIVQGAPMDVRTNHVRAPGSGPRIDDTRASNSNSLGITLVNAHTGATVAQIAAAERLANEIGRTYDIPAENVLGHGELQNNRMSSEGREIVQRLRNNGWNVNELPMEDRLILLSEAVDAGNIGEITPHWPRTLSDG